MANVCRGTKAFGEMEMKIAKNRKFSAILLILLIK